MIFQSIFFVNTQFKQLLTYHICILFLSIAEQKCCCLIQGYSVPFFKNWPHIPDPYGDSVEDYIKTFEAVKSSCEALWKEVYENAAQVEHVGSAEVHRYLNHLQK